MKLVVAVVVVASAADESLEVVVFVAFAEVVGFAAVVDVEVVAVVVVEVDEECGSCRMRRCSVVS